MLFSPTYEIIISMKRLKKLVSKYYRLRSRYYRESRLLFPSPAELRFIELMGGRYVTLPFFRHYKTGFCGALVLSMGKTLRREGFRREVRVGAKFCDFGNDIKRAIEIDGSYFHDIVEQQERDDYFAKYDWRVLHIDATDVWRQPDVVQRRVLKFLND